MRIGDMIPGEEYVLAHRRGNATFEGKHGGTLVLADGSTFDGGNNLLRFRIKSDAGDQIVLLDNAGAVAESVSAMNTRKRQEAEIAAQKENALTEAEAFLTSLGLVIAKQRWEARDLPDGVHLDSGAETVDDVPLDGLTIGKLKKLLNR